MESPRACFGFKSGCEDKPVLTAGNILAGEPSGWVWHIIADMYLCNAAIREGSATIKTAQSLPGALKMDVKAHVMTSEDQRYTGHSQVQSQVPHHL